MRIGTLHEQESCSRCMSEQVSLALHAAAQCLAKPLLERGIPQFIEYGISDESLGRVQKEHASAIEHFPGSISPIKAMGAESIHVVDDEAAFTRLVEEGSDVIYVAHSRDSDHEDAENGIIVRIHDLMSIDRSTPYGIMFHEWWQAARLGQIPEFLVQGAYWCSIDDVAEGMLRIIKGVHAFSGSFDMCGRRYWTMEETWKEFEMLVARTVAGNDGNFRLSHLEADGGPAIHVEELSKQSKRTPRPSLEALHETLLSVSNEGWNPRTPFRQSLMLLVADLAHHYELN